MKNRAIENPFTHHRDTEIAENRFVFAHGETAMAKDIPGRDRGMPEGPELFVC